MLYVRLDLWHLHLALERAKERMWDMYAVELYPFILFCVALLRRPLFFSQVLSFLDCFF